MIWSGIVSVRTLLIGRQPVGAGRVHHRWSRLSRARRATAPAQAPFAEQPRAGPSLAAEPPGRWWSLFQDPLLDTAGRAGARRQHRPARRRRQPRAVARLAARDARRPIAVDHHGRQRQLRAAIGRRRRIERSAVEQPILRCRPRRRLPARPVRQIAPRDRGEPRRRRRRRGGAGRRPHHRRGRDQPRLCRRLQRRSRNSPSRPAARASSSRRSTSPGDWWKAGAARRFETGQAGALLEQTRAAIPTFEGERRAALYRLAVLTGRPPADFPVPVASLRNAAAADHAIPVGDGAGLLAPPSRRPAGRARARRRHCPHRRGDGRALSRHPHRRLARVERGLARRSRLGRGAALQPRAFAVVELPQPPRGTRPHRAGRMPRRRPGWRGSTARGSAPCAKPKPRSRATPVGSSSRSHRCGARRPVAPKPPASLACATSAGRESFQIVLDAERSLAQSQTLLAQAEAQLSTELITLFLALGGGWEAAPSSATL